MLPVLCMRAPLRRYHEAALYKYLIILRDMSVSAIEDFLITATIPVDLSYSRFEVLHNYVQKVLDDKMSIIFLIDLLVEKC